MPVSSRRLAVALALGVLALTGTACGSLEGTDDGDTTTTAPTTTTTLVPRGDLVPYEQLLPGQCFDRLPSPDQRRFAVLVIPCEEPHTHELYDQLEWTDAEGDRANLSVDFPGDTEVRRRAEELCLERFEAWIGTAWTASEYDIETFRPSEESWAGGDRAVLCSAYRFDGAPTEGSVRGSGR